MKEVISEAIHIPKLFPKEDLYRLTMRCIAIVRIKTGWPLSLIKVTKRNTFKITIHKFEIIYILVYIYMSLRDYQSVSVDSNSLGNCRLHLLQLKPLMFINSL